MIVSAPLVTSRSGIEYRVYPDAGQVALSAAEHWVLHAARSQAARGGFSVALSGGATPKKLHELIASAPYRDRVDWGHIEIFFGDERAVPPDHPDSNYRMARETLLDRVPILEERVHRMQGEPADLAAEARRYSRLLEERLERTGEGVPILDLVFLGMGGDGHTASLFPGTAALSERREHVVANDVPQLSTRRLTLTFPVLNAARSVVFLVTGEGKAERVAEIFEVRPGAPAFPAGRVRPNPGELLWLLDAAACSRLSGARP